MEELSPSIAAMTLLIREIAGMIAFKASLKDAVLTKELEKAKTTPRTVDEFLAEVTKIQKK